MISDMNTLIKHLVVYVFDGYEGKTSALEKTTAVRRPLLPLPIVTTVPILYLPAGRIHDVLLQFS